MARARLVGKPRVLQMIPRDHADLAHLLQGRAFVPEYSGPHPRIPAGMHPAEARVSSMSNLKCSILLSLLILGACSENSGAIDLGGEGGVGGSAAEAAQDGGKGEPPAEQPEAWDEELALPVAEDLDPDPHTLEVRLEARLETIELKPGVPTEMWTYNGSVPGPLLRADRGDRLIVHFKNSLPEPTTVHWHGLRVPAEMDGTQAVQNPVEPGDSFTYEFTLPDAGTFWYHPHINSSAQVGYGLYGPIVVDDPNDPLVADDLVVVFSDVSLDSDGQLLPGDDQGWFGDFFGREGSVLLVNGKVRPRLRMKAGLPQRWRIINAARARFFQTSLPGAQFVRVAGDAGLIERPQNLDELFLAPSERTEVLVTLSEDAKGEVEVPLEDADRFNIDAGLPDEPLFDIQVTTGEDFPPPEIPQTLRSFEEIDREAALPREVVFDETLVDGSTHLSINGVVYGVSESSENSEDADSSVDPNQSEQDQEVSPNPWVHVAHVGDTELWEVRNDTDYDHPFHLHGFMFQILELGGRSWPVREWKDTVNIPAGETLRFLVTYDDRPGKWMFHCHILDHAQLGMMAILDVRSRE